MLAKLSHHIVTSFYRKYFLEGQTRVLALLHCILDPEGCEKWSLTGGLCMAHGGIQKKPKCKHPEGCDKQARAGGFCVVAHGGTKERTKKYNNFEESDLKLGQLVFCTPLLCFNCTHSSLSAFSLRAAG